MGSNVIERWVEHTRSHPVAAGKPVCVECGDPADRALENGMTGCSECYPLAEFLPRTDHALVGTACTCGGWEAELGTPIWRGFDRHLLDVQGNAKGPHSQE